MSANADLETSSDRYKNRFRGATGRWFLAEQRRHLLSLLAPWPGASVLDVGGGHGQYSRDLLDAGYRLTILGGSDQADGQVRDLVAAGRCRFLSGDLSAFPVADKEFDIVVSFRLFTHHEDWRSFVAETTRAARHAVIFDLPVLCSFNFLYPLFFWMKRLVERNNTRRYNVFRQSTVTAAFRRRGYQPTARVAQFFLPMACHRALRCAALSAACERFCRVLGLTRHFGSPVILRLEPSSKDPL